MYAIRSYYAQRVGRERAGVGEQVEELPPAGEALGEASILALVAVEAGLLPARLGAEAEAALLELDRGGQSYNFV